MTLFPQSCQAPSFVTYTAGSEPRPLRLRADQSMPKHAAQRRPRPESVIPDKLYFRIGEVARLCGVETYVLRYLSNAEVELVGDNGFGPRAALRCVFRHRQSAWSRTGRGSLPAV